MSTLYERAFRAAVRLGCRSILFHPYLVPLRERAVALERWFGYWRAMARRAESEGMHLALENVYDKVPDEIRAIVDDVSSPALGTCVDLAHATLFAQDHDPLAWVGAMGDRIKQVHLSDNDRSRDQHRTLGEGELDLGGFLGELARVSGPVTVVLEVGTLEAARQSVEHLRKLGVGRPQVRSGGITG
jgi:sugar phosphate isomerase/epimerase